MRLAFPVHQDTSATMKQCHSIQIPRVMTISARLDGTVQEETRAQDLSISIADKASIALSESTVSLSVHQENSS